MKNLHPISKVNNQIVKRAGSDNHKVWMIIWIDSTAFKDFKVLKTRQIRHARIIEIIRYVFQVMMEERKVWLNGTIQPSKTITRSTRRNQNQTRFPINIMKMEKERNVPNHIHQCFTPTHRQAHHLAPISNVKTPRRAASIARIEYLGKKTWWLWVEYISKTIRNKFKMVKVIMMKLKRTDSVIWSMSFWENGVMEVDEKSWSMLCSCWLVWSLVGLGLGLGLGLNESGLGLGWPFKV